MTGRKYQNGCFETVNPISWPCGIKSSNAVVAAMTSRLTRLKKDHPAHADAGYETALDCAREHGLNLPGILG